nr:hypothetical protein [Tanacetum cinerariifolium]
MTKSDQNGTKTGSVVKESPRKGQNRIKTRQKQEAWRSREKSEAVTVERGRKTEQNVKRMAENANTCKSYSKFKEKKKRKGAIFANSRKIQEGGHYCQYTELVPPRTNFAIKRYQVEGLSCTRPKLSKDLGLTRKVPSN